ncbi:hypothetical protein AGOR_G00065710 [Albula goreensis]|uniref:Synaptotagmin-like protein 5 n=1 Tax=Albula goreensis TaxID=1534307 RepID=A0A8T3DSP6_9TELE|nr:hypothetical protein AGOR_G00065710 [Albula goreensis]
MDKTPEALNLSFLLQHEREMILSVLQKDEKLRKLEEERVRKLKSELQDIKHRGTQCPPEPSQRQCTRCQRPLGLIFDRGEPCEECSQRVCAACRVLLDGGKWRCAVCAKISELKVVTGEWFVEERSKRFSQGSVPSSDVVKQSILYCPPGDGRADNGTTQCDPGMEERANVPRSSKSIPQNTPDAAKRKGTRLDKRNSRPALRTVSDLDKRPRNLRSTGSSPNLDTHSVHSGCSMSQSHSRGRPAAKGTSGPAAVPTNLRSKTIGRSPTLSDHSPGSGCSRRPDGAESEAVFQGGETVLDGMVTSHCKTEPGTPIIAVSKDSLSSDRSQSEVDLGAPDTTPGDDTLSLRCRSVPGELSNTECSDNEGNEDIDALMLAHGTAANRSTGSTLSTSTPQSSERKWSYLNVPDSDAETSSLNSMMSVYSEAGDYGNASVSGEILLHITYSYKTGALNILVKECRGLAIGDERKQRTDPYVKTYLLPDKSRHSKRKTSTKTNTTSPVFNETLKYVISRCQLETRTLQLSVWHSDRFGRNCFLGEAEVPFESWDFDTQAEEWFSLQPKVASPVDTMLQYKGEMTVVLRYIPAEKNLMLPLDQVQEKKGFLKGKKTSIKLPKGGMVELLIKEAKNLTAVKYGGTSDTFVKGYLLPDNNKSTKHKTAVVRKSVSPRWNHTFTYCGLQPGDLNNVCLELTVWDKESLSSNVFLGGIRLGAGTGQSYGKEVDWMDSYGEEQRLWQRMIDNPEIPQECTLMLRSTMDKHNT